MPLPTPTLHTDRLTLRAFADSDADALWALHSNAHVLRYWDSPPWTEPSRAQRFLATCRTMEEEGTAVRVAMDRTSDGEFVGWCSLNSWNPDFRSASLGYCLAEAAWGHGYATEAAGALIQWAFETHDLNRIQAECDTRNAASGQGRWRSSASSSRERCARTAWSTVSCRTRGSSGCSGGSGGGAP